MNRTTRMTRMTWTPRLAVALALTLAVAATVAAGPAAAADRFQLGLRLGGFEPSNSPDSYDAVYGGTMTQAGVQFEVHTARRLFFQATLDYGSGKGERVDLVDGRFEPNGLGTTLKLTPLHLTAAWLFRPRDAGWNAYAGLGPSLLAWSEDDDFDHTSATDTGASVVLGLRKPFRTWSLGGELRWSTFPNALDGRLPDLLGEGDLGGLGLHVLGLYRF